MSSTIYELPPEWHRLHFTEQAQFIHDLQAQLTSEREAHAAEKLLRISDGARHIQELSDLTSRLERARAEVLEEAAAVCDRMKKRMEDYAKDCKDVEFQVAYENRAMQAGVDAAAIRASIPQPTQEQGTTKCRCTDETCDFCIAEANFHLDSTKTGVNDETK